MRFNYENVQLLLIRMSPITSDDTC